MSGEAVHMIIRGRVQGVFFRANTEKAARDLNLSGWVRNLPDGAVEVHAEGEEAQLQKLIEWCHKGPAIAQVTEVQVDRVPGEGFQSFDIR